MTNRWLLLIPLALLACAAGDVPDRGLTEVLRDGSGRRRAARTP
jgi:hypothetical protein